MRYTYHPEHIKIYFKMLLAVFLFATVQGCSTSPDITLPSCGKGTGKSEFCDYSIDGALNSITQDYPKALSNITKSIETDPSDYKLYLSRADIYYKQGNYDLSGSDYQKALSLSSELSGKSSETYLRLAKCRLKSHDFTNAILALNNSINIKPSIESYSLRAGAYYCGGLYKNAEEDYSKAISFGQNKCFLYKGRAKCYIALNKPDLAIEDLSKAVSINKKDVESYQLRAGLFLIVGSYKNAEKDYTELITLKKAEEQTYTSRAICYEKEAKYEEALADIENALKLSPAKTELLEWKGCILSKLDRFGEARFCFDKAVTATSDKVIKSNYLAGRGYYCFYKAGAVKDALADFNEAIKLNKQNAKAYLYKSLALTENEDYNGAISVLNEMILLNTPDNFIAHYQKGIVLELINQPEQAAESYMECVHTYNSADTSYLKKAQERLRVLKK